MNHQHVKYLLAGGGLAGGSAAAAIRKIDPRSTMLMVGQEINRPYHRSPLSKDYLFRHNRREELFTASDEWFAQNNVDLRTGRRVERLDTARHTVTLDNGQEISYDKLLIATGASARRLEIPGADLPNIFYVRSLDDVERLRHAIDKAKTDGRAHSGGRGKIAVIGGGVLGVELSATLTQLGLGVDLIVGPEHPWKHFAGEPAGRFISRYLEGGGITVHNGRRAARLEGDGRVQRVVMDDVQSIPCDFAIAAVGSVANRDLLRGTPLAAEKAILVDARCRTSDPNIFSAGDCAAIFDPLFAKHRIIDHANHAQITGAIAGTNMAGGDAAYHAVNSCTTKLFDLTATIFGEPKLVERRIVRGQTSGESPRFAEIGIAHDGRVAQVLAIGADHDFEALKGLVAQRLPVQGNEESMKDSDLPLA